MATECNGRTHAPNLAEVVADLDGLRALMDERDRRYAERYEGQEKAISKSEAAQKDYNAIHNDLVRKMEAQSAATLSRSEADAKFKNVEDRIADLRESRSGSTATTDTWKASGALVLSVVTTIGMIVGLVVVIVRH